MKTVETKIRRSSVVRGQAKDIAPTQPIIHARKIFAPSPKYSAEGPVDVVRPTHECQLFAVCILSMISSIFSIQTGWEIWFTRYTNNVFFFFYLQDSLLKEITGRSFNQVIHYSRLKTPTNQC